MSRERDEDRFTQIARRYRAELDVAARQMQWAIVRCHGRPEHARALQMMAYESANRAARLAVLRVVECYRLGREGESMWSWREEWASRCAQVALSADLEQMAAACGVEKTLDVR